MIIIYIVKFYLTFSFPSDTPSVKTVITVIVIAVITLDALKQCIKVDVRMMVGFLSSYSPCRIECHLAL